MPRQTIGFIGVGLLGTALAERLLNAGYQVVGFDIDSSRTSSLERIGGRAARSASDVVQSCDRVIFSLPDSDVVQAVVAQIDASLGKGTVLVDTTTGRPDVCESLGAEMADRGVAYLDATVAGSSQQARVGEIVIMVGGEQVAVDLCQDLFSALARQTFHVGPCGSGSRMKLVVNLVLGLNRAVLAEGLWLARSCGIAPATALEVLQSSPAHSAAMDTKGLKMVQEDFTPQARLAQHRKDVRLILELAQANRATLPLSQAHSELLDRAIERGFGELDNSAVLKAFD